MEKIEIFTFLKSMTVEKKDLSEEPTFYRDYNPFMVNRFLAFSDDMYCVSLAMYLSSKSNMDKYGHYKFLFNELPKRFTKFKYPKSVNIYDKETLNMVSLYFDCSIDHAKLNMILLSEQHLKKIKRYYGGKK